MKTMVLAALGAAVILAGCTEYDRPGYASDASYRTYDYNNPDPAYGGYYADRYYRDGPSYRERRLAQQDRVYRGNDGRYYCRRSDGTTGLVIGAAAGGVLGNLIAPGGGSELLGTLLGAAGGAAIGASVDRNDVRCR